MNGASVIKIPITQIVKESEKIMKKIIIALSVVFALFANGFSEGNFTGYIEHFGLLGDGSGLPLRPYIKLVGESTSRSFRNSYIEFENLKLLTTLVSVAITNGKKVYINWDDNNIVRNIYIQNE